MKKITYYILATAAVLGVGATLPVSLYIYAKEHAQFDLAFSVAVVLLVVTFIINLLAKLAEKKLRKR